MKKIPPDAIKELTVHYNNWSAHQAAMQTYINSYKSGDGPRIPAELVWARVMLAELEKTTTGNDVETHVKSIREHLDKAGLRLADLDPLGRSTDAQMEKRLQQAASRGYLIFARREFSELEKTAAGNDLEVHIKIIKNRLAQSGFSIAALDESGASTDAQMEERFQRAVSRIHLIHARREFAELKDSETGRYVGLIVDKIKKSLSAAGADMSALDPSGKYTAGQMDEYFQQTVARAYLRRADDLIAGFEEDRADYSDVKTGSLIVEIRNSLLKAGADPATVDVSRASLPEQKIELLKQAMESLSLKFIRSSMHVRPGGMRAVKPFKLNR